MADQVIFMTQKYRLRLILCKRCKDGTFEETFNNQSYHLFFNEKCKFIHSHEKTKFQPSVLLTVIQGKSPPRDLINSLLCNKMGGR